MKRDTLLQIKSLQWKSWWTKALCFISNQPSPQKTDQKSLWQMKVDSHVFTLHIECVISVVRAAFLTREPWGSTEMLKRNRRDDVQKQTTFNITEGPLYLSFLTTLELQSRQTDVHAYSRWWGEALFPPLPCPLESSVSWTAFEMAGSDTSLPSNLAEPHWRAPGMFLLLMSVLWHTTAIDGRWVQFTCRLPTKLEQRKEKNPLRCYFSHVSRTVLPFNWTKFGGRLTFQMSPKALLKCPEG